VIKQAVVDTYHRHNIKTSDMGGSATTTEFMKNVIEEIKSHTPEIGFGNGIQAAQNKA